MNIVILSGRLAQDPKILTTQAGKKFATLTIATNKPGGVDATTGERKQYTQFHRVTVWDERCAENIGKYTRKGSWMEVNGELDHRKYQHNNEEHWITEVVVRSGFDVHFHQVERRNAQAGQSDQDGNGHDDSAGTDQGFNGHQPSGGNGKRPRLDDDIPF